MLLGESQLAGQRDTATSAVHVRRGADVGSL